MIQNDRQTHTSVHSILLYSVIITAAAQIKLDLSTNNFKISIAVILFPLFVFFLDKFPLICVTILSSTGVFLSRCAIQVIQTSSTNDVILNFIPETCFYLLYGLLLYLFQRTSKLPFTKFRDFILLSCIDYIANLAELLFRSGLDAFAPAAQASILLAALFRSGAAYLIITVIQRSHLLLLKKEHASRYKNLLLLISKLNSEIIWMKKNTSLVEETMNTSYGLYRSLARIDGQEDLAAMALKTAKDIHEIKKEYAIILKGISEALELNLQDEGMLVCDLMKLLSDMFTNSSKHPSITFQYQCSPCLFTERHYFLLSIFHNLLTNAAEACEGIPNAKITCTQTETNLDYLFLFEDSGRGIDSESLTEIFHPGFSTKINYRTGEVSRGLGLNLVQDLVENQFHGTISAASTPGSTIFTVSIPKTELKVVLS